MYELGQPAYPKKPKKIVLFEHLALVLFVVGLLGAIYWFAIKKDSTVAITNNPKPIVREIKSSDTFTPINEPSFSLVLPGTWKETSRDTEPGYHSIMWNNQAKGGVARWLKVYEDAIPTEYAVNYMIALIPTGNQLSSSSLSGLCTTFTPGAIKQTDRDVSMPIGQDKLSSIYKQAKFMCDNSHVTQQTVGTSSAGNLNSVTVAGPTAGSHKYFFIYNDANFHPDYTIFSNILDSFKAK